jgi:hypothetical protein
LTRLNTVEEFSPCSAKRQQDDVLDKKVGVAVVGAGLVGGQAHVLAFSKVPGSELVALGNQMEELIDARKIGKPLAVWFREFIAAKDLPMQWPANSSAWNIEKSGGYPDFTLSISRGLYTMDTLRTDLWSFLKWPA